MTRTLMLALLGMTALVAAPALARQSPPATVVTGKDVPPEADAAAGAIEPAPPLLTPEEAATQARLLQAQVDALQAQLDALKKQMGIVTPGWKGAPQFASDDGFTFKPKGIVQLDAGYVSIPGRTLNGTVGGLNYDNLGFNTRARRLIFGAEGTLPGGFGYKVEFDLAQGTVSYEDIVLTYQEAGSPIQVTFGNFYPLSSLDTMTSSRVTSFLERAELTDAFGYNRRLGAAIGYVDPGDVLGFTIGAWSDQINNVSFQRTGYQLSARGTWSPQFGATRFHLGANYQYRVNPTDAQSVQYRARPYTQLTDQRFADTGLVASRGDQILGVELAAIHGPLHFAGEAQQLWVDGYRRGTTFKPNNGAGGGLFYAGDPRFFSAYGEVGFYLTGETRGYKGGRWDRTKVLKPIDKGGFGAVQLNARYDYLDLTDRVASGTLLAAENFVNGGKQIGYELSLIWNPMDYIRFMAQYARAHVEGGPRAGTVVPAAVSAAPLDERDYDVDTFGFRAQVDF